MELVPSLPSCLGFRTYAVWVRESRNCQLGLDNIDASNILPNILISRRFVDVLYHAFDIQPPSQDALQGPDTLTQNDIRVKDASL